MIMITTVAEDGKLREMLMLPINYLNGWLFGVDAERVNPEIKDRLIAYQAECFEVLADHFMPRNKPAPAAPTIDPDRVVLMREIANQTKRLVRCRNPMERNTLARCVMHLNEMAGFADHLNPWVLAEITDLPPLLDQDGEDAGILATFWANYARLEHYEALNHMNKPGFIALNLAYVLKACQHKGMVMEISKDRLYLALRASAAPYPEFVKANFALGSRLMPKKIIKCWIFKATANGGVQ